MVFSTNQARHFYVANTVLLNEGVLDPKTATPGTIKQGVDEENQKIYYKYSPPVLLCKCANVQKPNKH